MAVNGERLQPGTVYVAPPNYHLLVNENNTLVLTSSPKVNYARPSVDVLFESVASNFRERAIGVVLTGKIFDGAKGADAIKRMGGHVIVQDRNSARAFDMPLNKIAPALITMVMVAGAMSLFSGQMPLAGLR